MLNKPAGVTSTASEPGRRRAVTELIDSDRRLYPVGRLDADSTGLILVTNDGELANRLMHPRYEVAAHLPGAAAPPARRRASIGRLRDGVELDDGPTAPAQVRRVSPRVLEITIREGRNRQVRRMAEAIGNEVVELERIAFGPLRLGEPRPAAVAQAARRRAAPALEGSARDERWSRSGCGPCAARSRPSATTSARSSARPRS